MDESKAEDGEESQKIMCNMSTFRKIHNKKPQFPTPKLLVSFNVSIYYQNVASI